MYDELRPFTLKEIPFIEYVKTSDLNMSLVIISSLFNAAQIVHAWIVYYQIRYVKFKHNSKKDILYQLVENDIDVELTPWQFFYKLPSIIFSQMKDHVTDAALIYTYRVGEIY